MLTMKEINFKDDFNAILHVFACGKGSDGSRRVELGWPQWDWKARFWTSIPVNYYEASCIDGVCKNCFNDNGLIRIVFNNHRLSAGDLKVEFTAYIPDDIYPDGDEIHVVPGDSGIKLVRGRGECPSDIEMALLLPALKGEKGDKGADAVVCGHIEVETDRGIYRIPVASQEVTFTETDAPGTCYGYYGDDNFCIGEWDT